MSDTQFSDLPAGAQVVSTPQAQQQSQSQSFSDLPAGAQVVSTPQNQGTVGQSQKPSTPIDAMSLPTKDEHTEQTGQPGFLSRAYGTGAVGGAVQIVENTAKDRADKLVKTYEMLRNGDVPGAVHSAIEMIPFVDPKGPEMKALQKIIHAPLDEATEAFKASKAGNAASAIVHGASAVAPPLAAPLQAAQEDIKNNNWSGIAGDVVGGIENAALTLWGSNPAKEAVADTAGKATSAVEEATGTPITTEENTPSAVTAKPIETQTARPGTVNIAGVDVPVTTVQKAKGGTVSNFLKKGASSEGAQKFIDEQTQPAVVQANKANFAATAKNAIEHIQSLRGETPKAPDMSTFQDMSDAMQGAAQETYKKLDEAALDSPEHLQLQNEVDKAQTAYEEAQAAAKEKANVDVGAQGPKEAKGAIAARKVALQKAKSQAQGALVDAKENLNNWLEDNTFTKLQQKISDAKRTMQSDAAGADDKAIAKRTIEETKLKLDDFVQNHGHNVEPGELEAANGLWKQSKQFDFLRDKMRAATRGTEGTPSVLQQVKTRIDPRQLESIPSAFDKEFGEGAFHDLLGDKGLTNFNNQINALKNPIKGGTDYADFMLKTGPLFAKVGILGKAAHWLPDQILFNPEFGKSVLDQFNRAKSVINTPKPKTTSSLRGTYNGLQNNLAG